MEVEFTDETKEESGLILYPEGHAYSQSDNLLPLLHSKFQTLTGNSLGQS